MGSCCDADFFKCLYKMAIYINVHVHIKMWSAKLMAICEEFKVKACLSKAKFWNIFWCECSLNTNFIYVIILVYTKVIQLLFYTYS